MWNPEKVAFLKSNYSKLSREELQTNINKTWSQIMDKAYTLELKRPYSLRRTYKINENYFDKIDTEDKAYFLGLLFADGYNNTKNGFFSISLMEKDKEILEEFSKYIYTTPKELYTIKQYKNNSPQKKLCVYNKNISNRLAELGCVQAKSKILKFPDKVPLNLIRHFIRGYFDGDGCVHINKKKSLCISLVGTKNFCEQTNKYLQNIGNIYPTDSDNIFKLQFGGNNKAKIFFNKLYDKYHICLNRKKEKFLEIIK